jgi:hypothetical protein
LIQTIIGGKSNPCTKQETIGTKWFQNLRLKHCSSNPLQEQGISVDARPVHAQEFHAGKCRKHCKGIAAKITPFPLQHAKMWLSSFQETAWSPRAAHQMKAKSQLPDDCIS